jgi:hypothetical protein
MTAKKTVLRSLYSFFVQSAPCLGPVGLDAGGEEPVARVQRCRHLSRLPVLKLTTKKYSIGTNHKGNNRRGIILYLGYQSVCPFVRIGSPRPLPASEYVPPKAVNREDKRSRRYRDRDLAKFESSRRYRHR